MLNILVSGASGFVGSHFVGIFKNFNYFYLSNTKSFANGINASSEIDEISKYIVKNKIDYVLHLATYFTRSDNASEINAMLDANLVLGIKLLAAGKHAGVKKFIYAGSYYEYFDSKGLFPKSLYAVTKKSLDIYAEYYSRSSSMKIAKLVLCDNYGPNDPRDKILNKMLNSIIDPLVIKDSKSQIAPLYVKDTCSALNILINSKQLVPYTIHLIWPKKTYSLMEIFKILSNDLSLNLNITFVNHSSKAIPITKPKLPILKNWNPSYSILEGIKETIALNDN